MGGHGMGGGGQFGGVMRSMRRDDSVTSQRVTKGTARRMIQFARPYRTDPRLVPGAGGHRRRHRRRQPAAVPLHHRQRHPRARQVADHRAVGAGRGAGPRRHRPVHRDPVGLGQGRRGPHLRHAVEGLRAHPEDADRLLHPHPDRRPDQPAQQRRHRGPAGLHRHPVVGGLQPDQRDPGPDRDVRPVVADHVDQPGHPAALRAPGQAGRAQAVGDHPRVLRPQRPDEQHHDRAVQRVGGPAGQAVRPTGPGAGRVRAEGRPGARHRGHPGHVRPVLHRRPDAHRGTGHRRGLRVGRHPGGRTARCSWGRWWRWPPT